MKKLKFLGFMSLLMVAAVLSWAVDPGWAQQTPAPQNQQTQTNYEKLQEELAARRAAQGQMRGTTPAQKKAAAERLKATLGAQSAPTSGGGVNK